MTPETTLGCGMVCFGTWLRLICFKRLAKYFTFELSLKSDHRLITDGPYAIVRHPSYTGVLLNTVGTVLFQLGRGSLWYQQGLPGRFKWLGIAYAVLYLVLIGPIFSRTKVEDAVLSEHFGDEWRQWAQRTPYRIIPGIF